MSRRNLLSNTSVPVLPLRYAGEKLRAGCFLLTLRRVTFGSVKHCRRCGDTAGHKSIHAGKQLAKACYRTGKSRRAPLVRTARHRRHRGRPRPGWGSSGGLGGRCRGARRGPAKAAAPPPAPTAGLPRQHRSRPGAGPAKTTRDRFLGKWFM